MNGKPELCSPKCKHYFTLFPLLSLESMPKRCKKCFKSFVDTGKRTGYEPMDMTPQEIEKKMIEWAENNFDKVNPCNGCANGDVPPNEHPCDICGLNKPISWKKKEDENE